MIDITEKDLNELRKILSRVLTDRQVIAFGSRVNGTAKEYSDLDLAVVGESLNLQESAQLREAFEESGLTFRVDFSNWNDLPEKIKKVIESNHFTVQKASRQ